MDIQINEMEAKSAVYDYIMSHIQDKDFETTAAVAGDVFKIIMELGKK